MADVKFFGGWIESDPAEKVRHEAMFPITNLMWTAPDIVEVELYCPETETSGGKTYDLDQWYSQVGGTCVGYSGSRCTTVRNSTKSIAYKYRALELYKQCRRIMGRDPNNINEGATLPSCGKALRDWGHVLTIGDIDQAPNKEEGVETFYWGFKAEDARLALSQGKPVQFGIRWYSKFNTPKKDANGRYWLCSSDQKTWGNVLGGHAIMMFKWSDALNAGCFKNTWGGNWPDEVWVSAEVIDMLLAGGGEMMICIDRNPTPVGRLELEDAFAIYTENGSWPPINGMKISGHIHVKNAGTADLHLTSLGVKGLRTLKGQQENWDFGFAPCDLAIGQIVEINPVCEKYLVPGSYTFQIGYTDELNNQKIIGTSISFNISEPPLPPLDQITTRIIIPIGNDKYGGDKVILPKL